jgi:hypothetical protein
LLTIIIYFEKGGKIMKHKIVGVFACMLMIATFLPVVSAANEKSTDTLASGLIGIKLAAKVFSVDDSNNLLEGAIEINDSITGKYIYDSGIPDSNPNPSHGIYQFKSSSCGFALKAGGLDFKTNPSDVQFNIDIYNNYITDWDEISVLSANNLQLSNGMLVTLIQWDLVDNNGTAIDSDVLPTTAPVLEDWPTSNNLILLGTDPSNPTKTYAIYAHVTSATKPIAIDVHNAESNLATLMSTRQFFYSLPIMQFWIKIFERFPYAFPILRHLMGY